MKKILCAIIVCFMLVGLCACSSKQGQINLPAFQHTEGETTSELAMSYLEYIGTNLIDRRFDKNLSNHDAAVEFIISELKKAGYSDEQITSEKVESDYKGAIVQNIILSVKGKSSEQQIIVGAHYDGDGAGDNGSGIALLLAAAVNLSKNVPDYDVQYVFFDAEEIGMVGSETYANRMTDEEIAKTVYMINMDAISFGDYCNVYGGMTDPKTGKVNNTEAYAYACEKARELGIKVYETKDLDGYFKEHGTGPQIEDNTIYTNPWTKENSSLEFGGKPWFQDYSPSAIPASDHLYFAEKGIPYIYFEATNWFAKGDGGNEAYSGYYETYDISVGDNGMFMNTKYDTLENLKTIFPGRAEKHFEVFALLLEKLIMNPMKKQG